MIDRYVIRLVHTATHARTTDFIDRAQGSEFGQQIAAHLINVEYTRGLARVDVHILERANGFAVSIAARPDDGATMPRFDGADYPFSEVLGRPPALNEMMAWIADAIRQYHR